MIRLLYKYQDIHSTDAKGFIKTMIVTNRYKTLPANNSNPHVGANLRPLM